MRKTDICGHGSTYTGNSTYIDTNFDNKNKHS